MKKEEKYKFNYANEIITLVQVVGDEVFFHDNKRYGKMSTEVFKKNFKLI